MTSYDLKVSENFVGELDKLAIQLHTDAAGVLRKALTLLKHAANADEVKIYSGGKEQRILVK